MLRSLCFVAFTGVSLGLPSSLWADDKAETLAIVDKAIKAAGGEAKVAGLKQATYKAKGELKDNGVQLQIEISMRGLDQLRVEVEGSKDGVGKKGLLIVNGEEAWSKEMDTVSEAPKEMVGVLRQVLLGPRAATLLPLLKDTDTQLGALGEVKVFDRPAIGLKVTRKGFREFDLYFDKETGLPVKCDTAFVGPDKKETALEFYFFEPKELRGVKHFTKLLAKADGKEVIEFELTELKLHEKLDDSVFAKP